tara:strand:- start:372 stop:686 length:315 start_codon:yes stop_codon:yes gene_type:complete
MTIEEIRTATVMALFQSNKDIESGVQIPDVVDHQSKIVGAVFGNKFLLSCLKEAQEMKTNQEKFDFYSKKHEIVGNRLCVKQEDIEDEELVDLFLDIKGLKDDI